MNPNGGSSGRSHKITRLIEEHEFEDLGADLERRWTGVDGERSSLRDLADLVNERLVDRALLDADRSVIDGDVDNVYRLLSDDSVPQASRTRTIRQLERAGVDVDDLLDDFVTYQAVRSFLTERRGVEYQSGERDPVGAAADQIAKLQGRVSAVTQDKLRQLSDSGEIDVGSFSTLIEVNVLCEDCGARIRVDKLLERGGCECTSEVGD